MGETEDRRTLPQQQFLFTDKTILLIYYCRKDQTLWEQAQVFFQKSLEFSSRSRF